jgi:hypothetical protein
MKGTFWPSKHKHTEQKTDDPVICHPRIVVSDFQYLGIINGSTEATSVGTVSQLDLSTMQLSSLAPLILICVKQKLLPWLNPRQIFFQVVLP